MNIDIRLSLGFLDHPKTKKLRKKLGESAVLCLLRLWMWSAENRSDGSLAGMDAEDIELAADWTGEEGKLAQALLDCRWLDSSETGYALHDWEDHQQYASKSEDRHQQAKKAAQARWEKQNVEREHANSNAQSMLNDAASINEHANSNAPKHQNTKTPEELKNTKRAGARERECVFEPGKAEEMQPARAAKPQPSSPYTQEFETFWQTYPKKVGKDAAFRVWQARKREKRLPPVSELVEKIEQFRNTDQWQKDGGQFIPHPATWLNQGRWQDGETLVSQPKTHYAREPDPPEVNSRPVTEADWQKGKAKLEALRKRMNMGTMGATA